MEILRDDLWLCIACTCASINGDLVGLTDEETHQVTRGLDDMGPHLVPDFDDDTGDGYMEFSACGCDCCGTHLAGEMHRFAVLG